MKKVLSMILALVMIFSVFAISASADVGDNMIYEEEYNDSMYYADRIYDDYTVSGEIYVTDKDYFKFNLSSYSKVVFACVAEQDFFDAKIVDSQGETVIEAEYVGETSSGYYSYLIEADLKAGDYYYVLESSMYLYFDYTFYFMIDDPSPHNHSYDNNCDESCSICGEIRTIYHDYDSATCEKPQTCKVCRYEVGVALGHTYTDSCDEACNRCNTERIVHHDYKSEVATKATLSKNGKVVSKCSLCGDKENETVVYYPKTIKLEKSSYTYNGKAVTPAVIVKDSAGNTLKDNTDYTVSYGSGRKKTGTYKVTVKMQGKYSGTKTLTFKINPQNIKNCETKIAAAEVAYSGGTKKPNVTVKNSAGTKLKKGTDYTLTYPSSSKKVGTYKVTVKMKGNYTGTKTLTYKIVPTLKKELTAVQGDSVKIGAKSNAKITYKSSNKSVAKVDSKGTIETLKSGSATITVKSGKITQKIKLTVAKPSVKISANANSVYRGKKLQLNAKTTPSDAKVSWSVSDKKIATISSAGVLTGKKYGKVTVTAKITYKGKSYTSTYKVNVKVEEPNISVFVSDSYKYTDCPAVILDNNGSKPLKVLSRGSVAGVSVDALFVSAELSYLEWFELKANKSVAFCLLLEEKTIVSGSSTYFIYFEYDGELYSAACYGDRYGLDKCYKITHYVD